MVAIVSQVKQSYTCLLLLQHIIEIQGMILENDELLGSNHTHPRAAIATRTFAALLPYQHVDHGAITQ